MSNSTFMRPVATVSSEEIELEINDTQTLRALTVEGHLPSLLVLSREGAFAETVRTAAPGGMAVRHALDLDDAVEQAPNFEPGILLIDTADTRDIPSMLAQLTQHFPEMVVVVAGRREDSGALLRLTAEGRVFRFLLKPLSQGQTRLALKAAAAQHIDVKASSKRRSVFVEPRHENNYLATYGALAAGLLIAVAIVWVGASRLTGESPAPFVAQQQNSASAPGALPQRMEPVEAELALAKEAFAAGRYIEPRGESALDFYRSALVLDPRNETAALGVRSVVDKVLERAETALTSERLEEAVRAIETARDIDATHSRLAFLDVQIGRERERLQLTQTRGVGNRVKTLLVEANEHLKGGRLLVPTRRNARDSLLAARRLDPTDPVIAQSIRDLSATLAEEASKALAAGKPKEAQLFVDAARNLGSADAALAAVERQLADSSRGVANATTAAVRRPIETAPIEVKADTKIDSLVAEARQRLAEGNLVEPIGNSAQDSLAALRAVASTRTETEELSRILSNRLLDLSQQATEQGALDRAGELLAAAREAGGSLNRDAYTKIEAALSDARDVAAATSVVQAASLARIREVPAHYPREALLSGTEGWVDIDFTISPAGIPQDLDVREARPRRTFDRAALEALRQWRFEPIARGGVPIAQQATLRMEFKVR